MSGRDEQWSEWFEHDGKGCPVPIGVTVEVFERKSSGLERTGVIYVCPRIFDCPQWLMTHQFGAWAQVVRYRVRKPRALQQLVELVENLPAPQPEQVDA